MEDWKEILKEADEDYLIGIANKGIVKRAYKDKKEGGYEVLSSGDEAVVRVGGETVQIKNPLGGKHLHLPIPHSLPPCGAGDIGAEGADGGRTWRRGGIICG